jgi:hypothetical protein
MEIDYGSVVSGKRNFIKDDRLAINRISEFLVINVRFQELFSVERRHAA